MKTRIVILLATLAAVGLPVQAQVFKCVQPDGRTAYQGTPCPAAVEQREVQLNTAEPTAADAARARARSVRDQAGVERLEAERAMNRAAAHREWEAQQRARASKEDRCTGYRERAGHLENRADTWNTQKYRDEDRAEAKALRDRHFSECFGSR